MATKTSRRARADKLQNDPAFDRTRENGAEFGRAGTAAKLLRVIFREMLVNTSDRYLQSRLLKLFLRIIHTETVNPRGGRIVSNGEIRLLRNFNFNNRSSLSDSLYVQHTVTVDKAAGQATVTIPAFVPRIMVQAPPNATHFKLIAVAAAIDFDNETVESNQQGTAHLAWNHQPTEAFNLQMAIPVNTGKPVIVALGITFYQEVSGDMYALKNGQYNAAAVIELG